MAQQQQPQQQRQSQPRLQAAQAMGTSTTPNGTSVTTDRLSESLGSMAVSLESRCSSSAQLLAESTDTLMSEYEALDPALLGVNTPQRLVRLP